MIEVENLSKHYGSFKAIDEVSFTVDRGEVVGFLGPNGAGKTTTMRILTGFMPPSTGQARVAGFDIQTQSLKARKRIGYLPETVPLYKEMTVKSYLRFFGTIRGMDRRLREKRIKEVMDTCHIERYAETQIEKLSKGYRQLVGVAQAILHEPEVLILDEPTIGIDARQVVEIRQLIKDLGRDHTIIISSHILPEVSMICQKVIIIDKGRIVAVDSAENLSTRLNEGQVFEIDAKGPKDGIKASLAAVDGVLNVVVKSEGEIDRYLVECEAGLDIREQLVSSVVSGGHSLLGLKSSEMSLEEIFLKLTTKAKE
ncbi:MAG: ATP-binding cassette domain-containing protein [Proteobacteria bacterium]|nr:ATP-binding cassette domain-containing protein [Pseudomonadota bacterium]